MQTAAAPFGDPHPLLEGCAALLERGSRLDVRIASLVKAGSLLSGSASTPVLDLPFAVDLHSREEIQAKLAAAISDTRRVDTHSLSQTSFAHNVLQRRTSTPRSAVSALQRPDEDDNEALTGRAAAHSDRSVSPSSSSSSSSTSTAATSAPERTGVHKIPGAHVEFLLRQMREATANATPAHVAPECVMTEARRFMQPLPVVSTSQEVPPSSSTVTHSGDVLEGAGLGNIPCNESALRSLDGEERGTSALRASDARPAGPPVAPPPPRPVPLSPPPPPVARPSAPPPPPPPPPRPPASVAPPAKQKVSEPHTPASPQPTKPLPEATHPRPVLPAAAPAEKAHNAAVQEAPTLDWEQAAADALAAGTWKAVQDAKGRTYYVNKAEKKSCWNLAKELQRRTTEATNM